MTIIAIAHNETTLTREMYVFDHNSYLHRGTRLTHYSRETRATTRHKWNGPVWNSDDERKQFGSQLDRPQVIPTEVLVKLQQKLIEEILSMPLYVGWFNQNHVIRDDMKHITVATPLKKDANR